MSAPKVEVGQVWQAMGTRYKRSPVRVIEAGSMILVESTDRFKYRFAISPKRFNNEPDGYSFVSAPTPQQGDEA